MKSKSYNGPSELAASAGVLIMIHVQKLERQGRTVSFERIAKLIDEDLARAPEAGKHYPLKAQELINIVRNDRAVCVMKRMDQLRGIACFAARTYKDAHPSFLA